MEELLETKSKGYAHFDNRSSMRKVWEYVKNPDNIIHHAFYPFISYEKEYIKYNSYDRKIKNKYRELAYSAYVDRCIYTYYGYLLNEKYNTRVVQDGIQNVAVAYRTDLNKSNVHFAKEAIDFIRIKEACFIIVGDFKSFFDSLDHKYLKARLCDLLAVDSKLPNEYYAIFKNITKYSVCRIEDILETLNMQDTIQNHKILNGKERIFELDEFKNFKTKHFDNKRGRDKGEQIEGNTHKAVSKNSTGRGISQGSAISAILANIYMLDFDKKVNEYVKKNDGLYMRYSDDFIIVFPKHSDDGFKSQYEMIKKYIKDVDNLILEPSKTQIFEYNLTNLCNRSIDFVDCGENGKNKLNYLGFTFDGKHVTIRDKTLTKYYYRMYRKIKCVKKWYLETNRLSARDLYRVYSVHGKNSLKQEKHAPKKHCGNFFSYLERAQKIFGDEEPISRGTKRHMAKIKQKLKKFEK